MKKSEELDLNNFSREQILKLFAMIVMSEGYIHYNGKYSYSIRLETHKSSLEQHKLFGKLSLKLFEKKPKLFYTRKSIISELFLNRAVKELLKLSSTFKTTPYKEKISQYLSHPQPTISFIFNEPEEIKWLAIRIWFDFDGNISPSFKVKNKRDRKNGKIYHYYQVQFECEVKISETNPNLVNEFLELFKSLGIFVVKKKDKRMWSSLNGISIHRLNDIRKFVKYAKPLTNVKVMKSKLYDGISKKSITLAIEEILNSEIPLSKYFKNKEKALKYKNFLNSLLYRKIKNYDR